MALSPKRNLRSPDPADQRDSMDFEGSTVHADSTHHLESPPLRDRSPPVHADIAPADQATANCDLRPSSPLTNCAPALITGDPPRLDVRWIRKRTGMTQRQFAGWFGFSVATLRHWERGNRKPTGPAAVLLLTIRDRTRVVLDVVRKARAQGYGPLFARIERLKSYRHPPGFGEFRIASAYRKRRPRRSAP
jgi:transcriptional regulator with XRE-family HTH domain